MTDHTCFVCGLPIVGDEIDDRHECHEEGCPNQGHDDDPAGDLDYICDCDLPCHAACCPYCNADGQAVSQ